MWLGEWACLGAKDAAAFILPSLPHNARLFCWVILAVPILLFLSLHKNVHKNILSPSEVKTILSCKIDC